MVKREIAEVCEVAMDEADLLAKACCASVRACAQKQQLCCDCRIRPSNTSGGGVCANCRRRADHNEDWRKAEGGRVVPRRWSPPRIGPPRRATSRDLPS